MFSQPIASTPVTVYVLVAEVLKAIPSSTLLSQLYETAVPLEVKITSP